MSLLTPDKIKAPSMHAFLLHELKDLYDAEFQILEALPLMIEKAQSDPLKKAFRDHMHETEGQVKTLEQCFKLLNEEPDRVTCDGMKGVIKEGQHVLKSDLDPLIMDDALIGAAQRVEHYEMAAYEAAMTHARNIGLTEIARHLQSIMREEMHAADKLSKIETAMHAKK